MTILNDVPIKGMALDFLDKKKRWIRAKWWYYLSHDGSVGAIVSYNDGGRGSGGLCIMSNSDIAGYAMNINEVKPYQNQCQKDKRGY